MALVTLAEQPGTPSNFQMPNDCKQCRFFASSLESGQDVGAGTFHTHHHASCDVELSFQPVQTPYGAKSSKGRRPNMEDTDKFVQNFIQLAMSHSQVDKAQLASFQAQTGGSTYGSDSVDSVMSESSGTISDISTASSRTSVEANNYAVGVADSAVSGYVYGAVFDGHGGSAVSTVLSERLHIVIKEELQKMNSQCFLTLDHIVLGLKRSFVKMDSQLGEEAKTAGSTGVVSMISNSHVIVANCGDSRAVLSRGQQAYRLSRDHKPTQPDEHERIVRAGGRVCNYNGIRVMGLLAMTRAFGDHCLSNFGIIAEPEVTVIERQMNDEFVILASDGLWDVVSDSEACALASRCFMRAQERNTSSDTAAKVAASVLMRVALDKGSSDNITVLVIDLRK